MKHMHVTSSAACAVFAVVLAGLLLNGFARADDKSPPEVSAVSVPSGQIDNAIGELDALAAKAMSRSGIPGMAVAVVRDGKVAYAKGFGVRKVGEPAAVDADTVFQLASLSKPITGTIVAHQVATGGVSCDTPIVKHLPWFRLRDPWVTTHVTIGDMLSHRSGLPDHAGDDLEDIGYDRRQVLERLRMLPLAPFRITYAYTNFGFTSAAEAVAVAAKKDWATLAEDVLYKPLGMNSTSSRYSDFEKRANRAILHAKIGNVFQPKYQRKPDAQAPAGGVSSSVNEVARWMIMLLQKGNFDGRQVVDSATLMKPMTAQVISAPSSSLEARPGLYGFGFGVSVTSAGRIEIKHSGAFVTGAGTYFSVLPSLGVGIVVLTNAAPVGAAEALAADFMDLVQLGKIERDWFPAYGQFMAPMFVPSGSLVGKPRPEKPEEAAKLSDYLGAYRNDYYGNVEIVRRGEALAIKLGPSTTEYKLDPFDGDAFTFNPSSENQIDGSVSLATFKTKGARGFRSLTIEYLNEQGMGTFARR